MQIKICLAILILLILSLNSIGQEPLTYTEVIKVDSVSKDELYNRAKLWLIYAFNSANHVIQYDNKEEGQIIGKAIIKYDPKIFSASTQTEGNIKYTIKIFVREGRYKYEITDFIHDPYIENPGKAGMGLITTSEECPNPRDLAKGWSNRVWKDIKTQIEDNIVPLTDSLKQGMIKKTESESDDW